MLKIRDKDFENIEELRELIPIINDLNKVLEGIVVYRSHRHRETFWSEASTSIEKKWLQLEFALVTSSVTRSRGKLPRTIKIETDPEKIKKELEEFKIRYLIWKKEYLKEMKGTQ